MCGMYDMRGLEREGLERGVGAVRGRFGSV